MSTSKANLSKNKTKVKLNEKCKNALVPKTLE